MAALRRTRAGVRWVATVALVSGLILALAPSGGAGSRTARAAPPSVVTDSGDLAALIAAHKATLPPENSQAYVEPSAGDRAAFGAALAKAAAGDLSGAAANFTPLGYTVVSYTDTATERPFVLLWEVIPCARCWVTYILNPEPVAWDVAVEVPHPLWDTYTPELGIAAFLRFRARVFLMAGAHRYANGRDSQGSDMARSTTSIFRLVHEQMTNPRTQVVQYHGFTLDRQPRLSEPRPQQRQSGAARRTDLALGGV